MLLVAIIPLLAVSKDSEIATDAFSLAYVHVREETPNSCTSPFVQEMYTEGRSLGCRVMRQVARFGIAGTVALKEIPADGDLGGVVLIHARQAAIASTCEDKRDPIERQRGGNVIDPRNVTPFRMKERKSNRTCSCEPWARLVQVFAPFHLNPFTSNSLASE